MKVTTKTLRFIAIGSLVITIGGIFVASSIADKKEEEHYIELYGMTKEEYQKSEAEKQKQREQEEKEYQQKIAKEEEEKDKKFEEAMLNKFGEDWDRKWEEVDRNNNELTAQQIKDRDWINNLRYEIYDEEPEDYIEESKEDEEEIEVTENEPTENEPTFEQEQALEMAQGYIDGQSFSKKDLRYQLHNYHGFSEEATEYALENVIVDWRAECVDKAQEYLDNMSFSKQDLRNQLQYHKFASEDIEYAIENTYK